MIKRSLKLLMFSLVMLAGTADGWAQLSNEFFLKHVAIVDATERSINEKEYVRQVKLKAFDEGEKLSVDLGNEGYGFLDDGKGYDEVAGDGIYTTLNTFPYSKENPYNEDLKEKSVAAGAIINPEFLHNEALKEYLLQNPSPKVDGGLEVSIECDVTWCSCSSPCGGCNVKLGGRTRCVSCPKLNNCKFNITWSIF
jgi:hypothetical protein